jgi:hypothetical protein
MDTIKKLLKIAKVEMLFWTVVWLLLLITGCNTKPDAKPLAHLPEAEVTKEIQVSKKSTSPEFNTYWYAGEAEISSYKLEQARYGEMRTGKAVLIYVTEDFLPKIQVKANNQNAENVSVLKLNATKNFNTGIYPYSIMQSTFYPISNNKHAIKVSSSMQEWCGHVYMQLNNRDQFELVSHSYFEGEADNNITIKKSILENELWTQLRINPKTLPTGQLEIIPSFEFIRLRHIPFKAYSAIGTLTKTSYSINYPELNRTLTIQFNSQFPFEIETWEESFKSGFGVNTKVLTTRATKLKTIKSPYWQKNSNKDGVLRETLLLN